MGRHSEEAVVVEKMKQGGCGKIEDAARFRRPDGRTHRHQIEIEKIGAEAVSPAEGGEILPVEFGMFPGGVPGRLVGKPAPAHAEEAQDFRDEEVEIRSEQVPPLGEKPVEAHPVVLDASCQMADAQGHLAWLGLNVQFPEEAAEIRVGDLVEDDEAGIDRDLTALLVHGDRVGVAAGTLPVEEGDLRFVAQIPCAGETRDPGADDGDTGTMRVIGTIRKHGESVLPDGRRSPAHASGR